MQEPTPALLGDVTRLTYISLGPTNDALRVEFVAPDGSRDSHPLPNNEYSVDNKALQFMANWQFQPSDFDGTSMDVRDWNLAVPVVQSSDGWALSHVALAGAKKALRQADWFRDPDHSDEAATEQHGAGGGSDDSDGGGQVGARTDSDNGSGVDIELADESDSSGFTFAVE